MTSEFSRFVILFNQLSQYTDAWLSCFPADKFDWVPVETSSMKFGERVSRVTLERLVTHLCVAERGWVEQLKTCADGATISVPKDPELEARLLNAGAEFLEMARQISRENADEMSRLPASVLDKKVVFVGRQWTGMGLLWGIYAHRAFHLGNVDIYLRQTDVVAPEFFEFYAPTLA
ncbi:hypothetical protein WT83_25000 [Burkholderia territorii]|uniref:DinB family protein n=1 Tax=Burkholderia territorii TaxID=1503055 RepID=A0A108EAR3_9BURK|nr:hypothetical protein [Burkholderia territorii]KWN07836.1 hypothetical protein WT83_25000 [Burkholderia territorii]